MEKKFFSVIRKGELIKIALANRLQYEGVVISAYPESSCVELSATDGTEFVSLSTMVSFKIIKPTETGTSVAEAITNDIPEKTPIEASGTPSKEPTEKPTDNALLEENLNDFLIIIREQFKRNSHRYDSNAWQNLENSIKAAKKNHCFENDADKVKQLIAQLRLLGSSIPFQVPELSVLIDFLRQTKAGLKLPAAPPSAGSASQAVDLDTSKIFTGHITSFDITRLSGRIVSTEAPKEYLPSAFDDFLFVLSRVSDMSLKTRLLNGEKDIDVTFTLTKNYNEHGGYRAINVRTSGGPATASVPSIAGVSDSFVIPKRVGANKYNYGFDRFINASMDIIDPSKYHEAYKPTQDYTVAAQAVHQINSRGGLLVKDLVCAKIIFETLCLNGDGRGTKISLPGSNINFSNKEVEIRLQRYIDAFSDEKKRNNRFDVAFFILSRAKHFPYFDATFIKKFIQKLEECAIETSLDVVKSHIKYIVETHLSRFLTFTYDAPFDAKKCRRHYESALTDCKERIRKGEDLSGITEALKEAAYYGCLFNTEQRIIDKIIAALLFSAGTDFEALSTSLRESRNNFDEITALINESPTIVAYEVFLPIIEEIFDLLNDRLRRLYGEQLPDLTINCEGNITTNDVDYYVTVSVENEKNKQAAQNVRVSAYNGLIMSDEHSAVQLLKGGSSWSPPLKLNLAENVGKAETFDINFVIEYEYTDMNLKRLSGRLEKTLPVAILREDFKEVANPFVGKDGDKMYDDELFVGRYEIIEKMAQGLKSTTTGEFNYGHVFALYGQTRSGKSSILIHFIKKVQKSYGSGVVIADCGELADLGSRTADMLFGIANAVYKSIKNASALEQDALHDQHRVAELCEATEDILRYSDRAEARFKRFNEIVSEISFLKGKLVLLVMDEFTHIHNKIKEGTISSDFMMLLKAMFGKYKYSAVIAAQENIIDFRKDFPNEFGIMELERVTYLRKEDSLIPLIEKPLSIDGETIFDRRASERLFELTHGSPFLIVKLCNMVAGYFNRKKLSKITPGFIERFLDEEVFNGPQSIKEEDFEPQLADRARKDELTYRSNRAALFSVAKSSENGVFVPLDKIMIDSLSDDETIELVERLVDRDVLEKNKNAEYRIKISLLREWMIRNYG